jgi:hypothetical protein
MLGSHVFEAVSDHLAVNNLLSPTQSGFRKRFSTESALLRRYDDCLKNRDDGKYTGLLLVDFAKAFDSVHHDVLLEKMAAMGVSHKWFQSFLDGRSQRVSFGDHESASASLDAGVPQGAVLSPLLFAIFINDLPECMPGFIASYLYADDSNFAAASATLATVELQLNAASAACQRWAERNRIRINIRKSKTMVLPPAARVVTPASQSVAKLCKSTKVVAKKVGKKPKAPKPSRKQRDVCSAKIEVKYDGAELEQVTHFKLLGLMLGENIANPSEIVSRQKGKIVCSINRLQPHLPHLSIATRLLLVNAFVKPHFEYALSVWGPLLNCSQLAQLDALRRRCSVLVFGPKGGSGKLTRLHWLNTEAHVRVAVCRAMRKVQTQEFPSYLLEKFSRNSGVTRAGSSQLSFVLPPFRYAATKRAFSYYGASVWNDLPLAVRSAGSKSPFYHKLTQHELARMPAHY